MRLVLIAVLMAGLIRAEDSKLASSVAPPTAPIEELLTLTPEQRAEFWRVNSQLLSAQKDFDAKLVEIIRAWDGCQRIRIGQDGEPRCVKITKPVEATKKEDTKK